MLRAVILRSHCFSYVQNSGKEHPEITLYLRAKKYIYDVAALSEYFSTGEENEGESVTFWEKGDILLKGLDDTNPKIEMIKGEMYMDHIWILI